MKLFFIFGVLVQIAVASNKWEEFKATYHKVYNSEEEENYRKEIFLEKVKLVEDHNRKYEQGLSTYTLEINKFADRTKNELFSSSKQAKPQPVKKLSNYKIFSREDVPNSIDWRDYGVISPIANQNHCLTCWAFAIVSTVEAHMAIYRGVNVSLSQQNLADCVDPDFTCETEMARDILERSYQYIIDNNGIDTLESYPYEIYNVGNCRFTPENIAATIKGYANVTDGDEEELKRIVGTIGPVTVAITTDLNWSLFRSGIYYDENCMDEDEIFNHAVVVVGYGTENGEDYWLLKNSWGTWYAENGYIRMARNKNNNCGIASIARYPLM